ncbi:hypothetical protein AGABI2DRAFT_191941 [Agaricus bisporus var. bisporus H97]|uniref:hypothetical protein n=1 Tax=Agaricus bisporus var. bisporus (strain H97 / ATCC MYA-4626 / FGSC 10389) TaxID=936046 RepID=UPI00029F6538|nr:hypothetical protein AGABI2DRAFT_191941 [Agaricus bisporus var. bisporus H97]EKV48318.1 hypothetical protein AGABI2DRAFT_191941 [Agaricus bisporus var. bisporus H97]
MSSISFHPSARHNAVGESQYYSADFDTSASFTMNPLSSHPPRAPRNRDAPIEKEIISEVATVESTSEIDEEEDSVKATERKIRREEVWREMVLTSYGRDKTFKIIQYSIRVYLVFHAHIATSKLSKMSKRTGRGAELVQRLTSTAAGLSTTRKTLLLFNWLHPLTAIMAQQSVPFSAEQSTEATKKTQRPFLHMLLYAPPPVLLELANAISDDIATWSRLGLVGKKLGERAGRMSDWCWFLSTLVALVENTLERGVITSRQQEVEGRLYNESMTGVTAKSKGKSTEDDEKELARLQNKDFWLQISRAKLMMDLIFVCYELFYIKRARDTVKAFTGLSSAILSTIKAYNGHKTRLLKAALSG